MGNAGVAFAVILIITWTLQMVLSVLQVKRYFKRVNALRRFGRVASGMAGGRYRGRTYGILAVDPSTKRITCAEQLSGMTVFASPRPVPQLVGISLEMLLDDASTMAGLSPRTADAFRAAARTLRDSFVKADTLTETQEQKEQDSSLQPQQTASASEIAPVAGATSTHAAPISPTRNTSAKRRPHAQAPRGATRPALRFVKE